MSAQAPTSLLPNTDYHKDRLIAELESSKDLIEKIVDNLPLGIAVNKINEGSILLVNRQFSKTYGWPADQIADVDQFFQKVYPDPAYREQIKNQITSDMASGDPKRMVWKNIEITTQSGEKRRIDAKNIPLYDQNLMISTVLDVTELRRKEEALQTSLEKLDIAIQGGNLGTWHYYMPEGKNEINEYWASMLGYRKEDTRGEADFFFQHLHPDDKDRINGFIEEIRRGERESFTTEIRVRNKAGDYQWILDTGRVIKRDERGEPLIMAGAHVDIDRQKRTEYQLRASKEHLQILMQNASDAILACDAEGKIIFCNKTLKDWIGWVDESISPGEWPAHYGLYAMEEERLLRADEMSWVKALNQGRVRNQEFTIKRPGCARRFVEANGSALYGDQGQNIGAVVLIRDITDRIDRDVEIANATLDAIERERTSIASELHDGVVQFLSIVGMNLKNLAVDYPHLASNQRFVNALEQLENSIELSRNIAHRLIPISIGDQGLVYSVEELIEALEASTSISIKLTCEGEVRLNPEVELNTFRIIQEALSNSIQHSRSACICLQIHFEEHYLRVQVQDDGEGFDLPAIPNSKGIGLRTMRNRALKMGGALTLHSDASGTTLVFQIPID